MATHSSILAWETPWTEEPGGLQRMGSQRAGHDWAASLFSTNGDWCRESRWEDREKAEDEKQKGPSTEP